MSLRVAIVGLGRIGRGVLRTNFSQISGGRYEICVVCDVMTIDHVAYLLANDSTYGRPPFRVDCDGNDLILDGKRIRYQRVDRRRSGPSEHGLDVLKEFELDVLFDATGTASINDFQTILERNIARKALCTWNITGCDISIVYGVNHADYLPDKHHVISASTCTGNAMVPICYILDKHFGIVSARIATIHPQLSDQRVLDGYHSSSQLGRGCAASIIPTGTNVAKSTSLVLPNLAGKLEAISYRVPTAIVSVIDFTAYLATDTSQQECIEWFERYAENQLSGIIYCDYGAWGHQKASIDYMRTDYSAILLMGQITVNNKRQIGLALMHDNEHAYCCRVLDVLGVLESRAVT
ncbi:glyceraldehyde 3-phosphate dehydrogenase NAD-binding domain-containing protein [Methylomonas koyamae]|uniref:glyceraldehyde 3-phosphate dehydrogenase NAD-binding domain-containing protein n=1 Tax=Methylomonas koyamae TaxID=702114 RepID=UPI0006CFE332|nr:glyceraldehyde 3-phosphate dehydrogenase NAD-binding domain-containing protein [Methylomonas koyamae]